MKERGIYIGAKKRELGKWQFRFIVETCPPTMFRAFCPHVVFYLAKVHQLSPQGEMLQKGRDYKGIIWEWTFPYHRIIFKERTLLVPANRFTKFLYKIKLIRWRVYRIVYPIKFQ